MKLRFLGIISLIFLLTACGGAKKSTRYGKAKSSNHYQNKQNTLEGNLPDIEDLPNPLHQQIPDFESDVTKYIYMYKAIAMEEMGTFGIPASITLAQGILESD